MSMMSPSPEDGPERRERDPGVHPIFDELDVDVFENTGDPLANGFMSMFQQLPQHPLSNFVGYEVVVDTAGGGQNTQFDAVGVRGEFVVGVDRTVPKRTRATAPYLFVYGSLYAPEPYRDDFSHKERLNVWSNSIRGQATGPIQTEEGHLYAVCPGVFCRDAMMAYSHAYAVENLRSPEHIARIVKAPVNGVVLTVPVEKKPLVLFVESDIKFTDPIKNVSVRTGNRYVSMLDYVKPADY